MKLSAIARVLRSRGCYARTILPLGILLSHNAWADPSAVSVGDTSATNSGSGSISFPLTRSGDASYEVRVPYTTQDGGATAPGDYTAQSGTAIIPAGSTTASIDVTLGGLEFTDKDFFLQLLGAAGIGPTPAFHGKANFRVGFGTQPQYPILVDLNGDGRLDVVEVNDDRNGNAVSVSLNTTAPGATLPSYAASQTFATVTQPLSVTAADVNGDGKPDLVVVDGDGTQGISILLNTTAPGATAASFAAQQTVAIGFDGVEFMAAADVNGDGKPDIITADYTYGYDVSVLLNTTVTGATTVSYAAPQSFATGSGAAYVRVADLNGDGKPDLVVEAGYASSGVSALINTTAPGATIPSFAPAQTFATGVLYPAFLSVADVNGDGKPDVLVSNRNPNTYRSTPSAGVLLNITAPGATTPAFAAQQTISIGSTSSDSIPIGVADVNGDGKPDLLATDGTYPTVLLNTTVAGASVASFAAQQSFGTDFRPNTVTAADVNGDGKPDLLTSYNYGFSVLLNTTPAPATTLDAGSFTARQSFAAGSFPSSVSASDINGDGRPDLLVANLNDSTVSVLLDTTAPGATAASYASQFVLASAGPVSGITAADVNGDGLPDLLASDFNFSGDVSVWLNTTAPGATVPSFGARQDFSVGSRPRWISAADVNGDGKPDLLVANYNDNTVSVLLNTTTPGATAPAYTAQQTFAAGVNPRHLVSVDVNGDGRPDLLVANEIDPGTASVLINTTAPGATVPSYAPTQTFATGRFPVQVGSVDVNGDGKPDLLVANFTSGTVSVLLNNTAPGATSPAFATQQTFSDFSTSGAVAVAAADIDGDGKPDLLVQDYNQNVVSVLLNTTTPGSTTTSFATAKNFPAGKAFSLAVTDANGDGRPDIVAANQNDNAVSVLLNVQYLASASPTPGDGTIHYPDRTPNSFSFTPVTGATPGAPYVSNAITVGGLAAGQSTPVVFKGVGSYRINNTAATTAPQTVVNGDTVRILVTAAGTPRTAVHGGVVIGNVGGAFVVTTAAAATGDITPDDFAFTPVKNAALSSPVDSNSVTINGIDTPAQVTVSNGSYSIDGGAFTSAAGTISNGHSVQVRLTSSASQQTSVHAGLKVGTVSRSFTVTTGYGGDGTPDDFSFTTVTGAPLSSAVSSNIVTIGGIDVAVPVTVTNASYSIDSGPFTTTPGTISSGHTLQLQVTSAATTGTSVHGGVKVGSVSKAFVVTTAR